MLIRNIQLYPTGFSTGEGRFLSMYIVLNANESLRPYESIYVRAQLRVLNQLASPHWRTIDRPSKQMIYIDTTVYSSSLWTHPLWLRMLSCQLYIFHSQSLDQSSGTRIRLGLPWVYLSSWSQGFTERICREWHVEGSSRNISSFFNQVLASLDFSNQGSRSFMFTLLLTT